MGGLLLLWIAGGVYRRRKNRDKVIAVLESRCTGCGRCVKRCSHRVLEMVSSGEAVHVEVKYPERCTACGDCLGRCRFNALKRVERR
jgi:NAD-dependent dihydropyrimidine dehydrogenase PreA subunit